MSETRLDVEGDDLRRRRLRSRNLAVMAALVAFVVVVYAVAIVRLGGVGQP
jgi:hypothetical protein